MTTYGPRTRFNEDAAPAINYVDSWSYTGANGSDQSKTVDWGSESPSSSSQTMNDVVVENFHARRAKGEIFNNPMSSVKSDITRTPVSMMYSIIGPEQHNEVTPLTIPISRYFTSGGVDAASMSIDKDRLIDLAVTQAWANIDLSEAAVLATAAEGKKTVVSLVDILFRVYKIYKKARKLDIKGLKRELSRRELANRYMELRYALRPLMYDAKQILDAVKAEAPASNRQTFRGFASGSENISILNNPAGGGYGWKMLQNTHGFRTVEVRAGVLTQITDFSKLNVFGLDAIAETAWEITPFSFIFDWFFNIGNVIRSWTPEAGVKTLASWAVVKDTVSVTSTCRAHVPQPNIFGEDSTLSVTVSSGGLTETTVTTERIVTPQKPLMPHVNVNLDAFKLIDLGIILNKLRK